MQIDIVHLYQREIGRLLSPVELEILKDWQESGYSDFQIKEALKIAIFNGANANSYKYINKILENLKLEQQNDAKVEQAVATIVNYNAEKKQDTNVGTQQTTITGTTQTTSAEEEPDLSWL